MEANKSFIQGNVKLNELDLTSRFRLLTDKEQLLLRAMHLSNTALTGRAIQDLIIEKIARWLILADKDKYNFFINDQIRWEVKKLIEKGIFDELESKTNDYVQMMDDGICSRTDAIYELQKIFTKYNIEKLSLSTTFKLLENLVNMGFVLKRTGVSKRDKFYYALTPEANQFLSVQDIKA